MTVIPAPGTPEYEYQIAHWGDDIRPQSIAGSAVMIAVATVAVAARMAAQKMYSKGWTAPDWLIVAAWVIAVGIAAEAIVSFTLGFGLHQLRVILEDPTGPPYRLVQAFEQGYFVAYAWIPCLACIKLSLLFYYRQLFQVHQKWLNVLVWIMVAYVIAWAIASTPVLIFGCWPVQYFWRRMALFYGVKPPGALDGHCIAQLPHLAAPSITSTVSDFVILIIPMVVIYRLRMPLRRKIGLSLLFGLGAFVVATGVVRIYFVFRVSNVEDVTWNDIGTVVWTVVETCMGILCACIPPCSPLFAAWFRSMGILRSKTNTAPVAGPLWTWRTREKTNRTGSLSAVLNDTIPMEEMDDEESHLGSTKPTDAAHRTGETSGDEQKYRGGNGELESATTT